MGFIKDTFFGGAEKDAAKKQVKGIERGQDFIRQGTQEARQDIKTINPFAQQALQQGFQGASNIFGQALPQQANIFQQGNVGAQEQVGRGLQQFQNAILGSPVDMSQFQPTQFQQPDFGFLQNQQFNIQNPFAPPPEIIGPQPQSNNVFGGPLISQPGGGGFSNNRQFRSFP